MHLIPIILQLGRRLVKNQELFFFKRDYFIINNIFSKKEHRLTSFFHC